MKLDLGFALIGGPNSKDQKYIHITRKDVLKRINEHPAIDPWTKSYLNSKVKDYPDNALIFFVQNINEIVIAALNERTRVLKERNAKKDPMLNEIQPIECEGSCSSGGGIIEDEPETKKERETLFSRPSN